MMDLNEKLAQRRLELEKEKRIEESKVAEVQLQKDQAVKDAALKQLEAQGIKPEVLTSVQTPSSAEVEKEKEKILAELAQKRFTNADKVAFVILFILTVWGFFSGFIPGLIFLGFLLAYFNIRINKLKEQIISEGKSQTSNQ